MKTKGCSLVLLGMLLFASAVYAGNGDLIVNGQVGVGTTAPSSSAAVDISSTTKGFLPPRMTTTQRNAIPTPTKGLVIFNTTENALNTFNGSAWVTVGTPVGGASGTFCNVNCQCITIQNGIITLIDNQSGGCGGG